jgi:hypothetical protein
MGTNLRFHGQDADVVVDDSTVTLVGAAEPSGSGGSDDAASGGGRVVILRSQIASVELTPATLLAHGRLEISTGTGDRHTVHFARGEAQERFTSLEAIIRP